MSPRQGPRGELAVELRATARLAVPLILAQVAMQGQNVIEVVLAGHFHPRVLAAVAIGANLSMLPMMAMIGTLFAVPPSIAQLAGARRLGEIQPLFRQAIWTALGLGLLMMAVVRWLAPYLVQLAGIDPALTADVNAFLHAVSFAMPAIGLFVCCRGLSDGLSIPGPTMVLSVAGLVLLAPVGYVLMYGALGVPSMGAAGTGYAAVLVDWCQALSYLAFLRFSRRYGAVHQGRGRRRPDLRVILGFLRVGVPMGVSAVVEVALFSFAALAIGRFGVAAAGAHQIAINAAALTFMVPLGLASAITVRVGNAVGRGDAVGARRAGFVGFGLALALETVPFFVMLLMPMTIASFYTNDAAVIAGAVTLLQIAAVFQFSDGLQVACNGALRGMKDTRVPMMLAVLAYWGVGLPLGLILAFTLDLRAPGMWIGLTAGLIVASGLMLARFHRLSGRSLQLRSRVLQVQGDAPVR